MAVAAAAAHSCATNRRIAAVQGRTSTGRRVGIALVGRDHLRADAIIGMLYKISVFVMPSSPSPHLNSSSGASVVVAPPPGLRLPDRVGEQIRYLQYSIPTEEAYVHWVRASVHFHCLRHSKGMGSKQVQALLTWLSVERHVSASTHRQALSALLFFFQQVFGQ